MGWDVMAATTQSRRGLKKDVMLRQGNTSNHHIYKISTILWERYHSAASTSNGLLLIGGSDSPETTELLQVGTTLYS